MDGLVVMALNVTGNAFSVTSNTIDRQKRRDGKYSGKVNFGKIEKEQHFRLKFSVQTALFIRNMFSSERKTIGIKSISHPVHTQHQ